MLSRAEFIAALDKPPTWSGSATLPYRVGNRIAVPNPLTILDRVLMLFGGRRRSAEYRIVECVSDDQDRVL